MTLKVTNKLQHMLVLAIFTAISLIIFIVEAQIPMPIHIPGFKLGLSNIITLVLLAKFTRKDAFMVMLLRVILGSVFSGQILSLFYSLAGGILSFIAMSVLFWLFKNRHIWFVSIVGAVFHNLGQIAVAMLIFDTVYVAYYFVVLAFLGIVTGLTTGITAELICKRMIVILPVKQVES